MARRIARLMVRWHLWWYRMNLIAAGRAVAKATRHEARRSVWQMREIAWRRQ